MRIEARRTTTIDEEFASVAEFREHHPDFRIEAIDDKEVVSFCELCELPIFEGDEYGTDPDGEVYVHNACAPDKEWDDWPMDTDEEPTKND